MSGTLKNARMERKQGGERKPGSASRTSFSWGNRKPTGTSHPGAERPCMYLRKTHWLQRSESIRSRQGGWSGGGHHGSDTRDGSHDVSLGARHLQGGSRRLSVPPGAPLPLGAALVFCSGELPSIILLGSVVPLMLGQAGPIGLAPPGLGALGGGGGVG